MSDDFWDGFDFPTLDTPTGSTSSITQPIEQTPSLDTIMPDLKKRAMVVFFIIDISGSMKGNRIQAVNDAIRNLIPELKKREASNTNAEIRVAIMEFSSNANWRTTEPVPVSSFNYNEITYVGGGTNFGKAFSALNKKLSRNEFLKSSAGSYTPLIILMTDGKPSDLALYKEELDILKQNSWFQYATKAGIAIEEGALSPECRKVLLEFTSNESMVLLASNTNVLAKQIQLVTLTGVDFVTQRGSIQNNSTGASPSNGQFRSTVSSPQTSSVNAPQGTNDGQGSPSSDSGQLMGGISHVSTPSSTATLDPTSGANPEIPGLQGIDWENDFPTFN